MLLNPLQEQVLWKRILQKSEAGAGLLHLSQLATAAQLAHRLLANYAPASLATAARSGWVGDAAVFSEWLAKFDAACLRDRLISASRLGIAVTEALLSEQPENLSEEQERTPLLLVGFDRLLESQVALLNAWGEWHLDSSEDAPEVSKHFFVATNEESELAGCIRWLRAKNRTKKDARLLVVMPGLQDRRGELERALLAVNIEDGLAFEFSMGVPLGRVGLVRSGLMLLRWLAESLSESEVDWLLTSGFCVGSSEEETTLAEAMRTRRKRGLEQPRWSLDEFLGIRQRANQSSTGSGSVPQSWTASMLAARHLLATEPPKQSPMDWATVAAQLLEAMGWPGFRPESSTAFQARQRWQKLLEDCASLGFDGIDISWSDFVSEVGEAAASTIFASESSDAAIQISEPLESAGQLADGIWFLGAREDSWPGRGAPHPLLPIALQREAGMPHSSPQADWVLAQQATRRLLASADEVVFSYARQSGELESRPSRLVTQLVGDAVPLPAAPIDPRDTSHGDIVETVEDWSQPAFPNAQVQGGSSALTRQSLCPFQAFAVARLDAGSWQPAETGLNARQRGQLLHEVLHRVWGGPLKSGISTSQELHSIGDLPSFVGGIVTKVMAEIFAPGSKNSIPDRFPARFLELEAERLTRLVSEWLAYEARRLPFVVAGTEVAGEVTVAGLTFKLRLDRVDVLPDGSKLIIDYKSSDVGPSAWAGERPDDVQLPLYATSAVEGSVEGLAFGRIKPAKIEFCGRLRSATTTLFENLDGRNGLMRDPLTEEQMAVWRKLIVQLSEDFLAGRAAVNPKDLAKTCGRCHLHAVCRIYENQPVAAGLASGEDAAEDGSAEGESADA
jgi:probable DNA repair protein